MTRRNLEDGALLAALLGKLRGQQNPPKNEYAVPALIRMRSDPGDHPALARFVRRRTTTVLGIGALVELT